ncbi:Uncharacterised protein [Mycobacterium tuberculosis]|nr:Uncharacterised protein [Mycobacterium tuberculosis]
MSRPLVPGLLAENTTDERFLGAVVFRQFRALTEKNARHVVDVAKRPRDVEKINDPKPVLDAVRPRSGHGSRADYFDYIGRNIDLDVLARIPAYAGWVAEAEEALKGLGYL